MKTLIILFSYNRHHALKNALLWLKKYPQRDCDLVVFDDGSTDKELRCKLEHAANGGMIKHLDMRPPREPAPSKNLADSRIGEQRRRAVEYFLQQREYAYLFLMDDDILLSGTALVDAIQDYEMLRGNLELHVGALTLHAWHGIHSQRSIGGKLFALVKVTGESVLLMHRESIEKSGNCFGPHITGYADTQWEALRKAELLYYTRLSPPYEVQHIGVAPGGSAIHRKMPFWVQDCWVDLAVPPTRMGKRPYVPCGAFNPRWFMNIANKKGNRAACEALYRKALSDLNIKKIQVATSIPGETSSAFPDAKEKVSVTVRRQGRVVKEISL